MNRKIPKAVRHILLISFESYALNLVIVRKPSKQLDQFNFGNCHSLFPFFAASADLSAGVAFIVLHSHRESPLAVPDVGQHDAKIK